MQIRTKVLISFISLAFILTLAVEIVLHNIIEPQFVRLEHKQFEKNLTTIETIIDQDAHRLELLATDWGIWDQTFKFINDRNTNYLLSNLDEDSFLDDLEIDFAFFIRNDGKTIWHQSRPNPEGISLPSNRWSTDNPLLTYSDNSIRGIAEFTGGLALIGSSKVKDGEVTGSSNGYIVFGRYINKKFVTELATSSQLPVILSKASISENVRTIELVDHSTAISSSLIPHINSSNTATRVSLTLPRAIYTEALSAIRSATIATFFICLILTIAIYLFLSRHILIPIHQLNDQAEAFGRNSENVHFKKLQRKDEIGKLFRTFRLMAEKILCSQKRLAQEKEAYQNASLTDQLTGLHNRRFLETKLRNEIQSQEGVIWQIMMLDLDHFKKVNDHYGHDTGDKVLQQLSAVLKSCARQQDRVVRYGGEEFLIVAKSPDLKGAENFAERIRSAIEQYRFGDMGNTFHKTASFGFIRIKTPTLVSEEALERYISFADTALYAAKNNGRNRWIGIDMVDIEVPDNHSHLSHLIQQNRLQITRSDTTYKKHIQW